MDNVPGLDLLPTHRALLEQTVTYFRDDDRMVGMILGGPLAYAPRTSTPTWI
jgi:hypothetical protein